MNITLVQIDLVMGSRILLSLLKEKGYNVKLLQINIKYTDLLTQDDLNIVYNYICGSQVVGLSFNTFYALIAEQLAIFLKERGIRYIIIGGNHATALPEEVIKYADIAVLYEAEVTLLNILQSLEGKAKLSEIKGILYKENDKVSYNNNAPEIIWKLDSLPFQNVDTGLIKYFDLKNKLYVPDKAKLFSHNRNCYFLLASRGCPFFCTYCANSLYHSLDSRFKTVRKRSITNIIEEMEYALGNGFESFYITDDNFFSFTLEEISLFNLEYKKRIKRPFSVVGINPNNFKAPAAEKKLKLLINCGLTDMRIGIQSGSNKTLDIFKRGYRAEEVPELLKLIEKNRRTIWEAPYDKLHIALDFICDAIWETDADKTDTIKLALKVLKQYSIFFYTLVYLPGTDIYRQALKEGWINSKVDDIYLRGIAGVDDNIYNRLLFLIAVTKERGVTLSEGLIDHILELKDSNHKLASDIIGSIIDCIAGTEEHHNINLKHAALHPYLTGFNEWTKTKGDKGRKVLFRSYHEPYG